MRIWIKDEKGEWVEQRAPAGQEEQEVRPRPRRRLFGGLEMLRVGGT